MGARGNSGVILSQIVRGACDVVGGASTLDAGVFRAALREAANAAYRAVKTPVEGTMLTVIREMAAASQSAPPSPSSCALVPVKTPAESRGTHDESTSALVQGLWTQVGMVSSCCTRGSRGRSASPASRRQRRGPPATRPASACANRGRREPSSPSTATAPVC